MPNPRGVVAIFAIFAGLGTGLWAGRARAQTPGPAQPSPEPKERDYWKANVQGGLLYMSGNSNTVALSGSATVARKDDKNVFSLTAKGAYALARPKPEADYENSAKNGVVEARYDRILGTKNTVFLAWRFSGDTFAGIYARPEALLGYSRYFLDTPKQTFRGEAGLDYMYELYNNRYKPLPPAGPDERPHAQLLSARLFLAYENKFTPYASFSESVEVLMAFLNFEDTGAGADTLKHTLLTSVTSLSSTISKNVSIKINFTAKANFAVVDPVKTWDTVLEAVVGVTLL